MKISGSKHPAIRLAMPLAEQPLARHYLSLATAALLLFAIVSIFVVSGLAHGFDQAVHTLARDIQGPAWLTESARDITELGHQTDEPLLMVLEWLIHELHDAGATFVTMEQALLAYRREFPAGHSLGDL